MDAELTQWCGRNYSRRRLTDLGSGGSDLLQTTQLAPRIEREIWNEDCREADGGRVPVCAKFWPQNGISVKKKVKLIVQIAAYNHCSGDELKSFFYFESFFRRKSQNDMASKLLSYTKSAFNCSFEKLAAECILSEARKDFLKANKTLVQKFRMREEP